jgi:tetratricopeptide (TPR) repeat protein
MYFDNMNTDTFKRQFLFIAICTSFFLPASQGRLPGAWDEAALAYRQGNYEAAATAYETLLRLGYRSPALQYNLGKCYMQNGQKGKAILAFERALRLKPGDAAIKAALRQVRAELTDQLSEQEGFFLLDAVRYIAPARWALVAIVALWTALVLWMIGRRPGRKPMARALVVASTTVAILALTSACYTDFMENDPRQAVVTREVVTVLQAPDPRSPEVRQIHEGTKVCIGDEIAPWMKIRLENGDQGWINRKDIERITP